jgi:mevalonate kinase
LRIVVSAPGRVCLFGEHMDWCGHSVIPAAIDARMFVEVSPILGHNIEVHSFRPFQTEASFDLRRIKIDPDSDLRYVGAVLKAMLLEKRITSGKAFTIRLLRGKDVRKRGGLTNANQPFNDLPVRRGLSSSAALCVAVAASADLIMGTPFLTQLSSTDLKSGFERVLDTNLARYADLAYTGERKILGINCGQMDQYASAYGGILSIDCSKVPAKVNRLKIESSIPLVIGDTGQQKDTPRILAWLGKRFSKKENLFMEGVDGIVKVVSEAKKELDRSSPNLKKIGELMNLNQQYLSNNLKVSGECPISPSNLDKLVKAALDAGALGAKVSGSGGGGCIVALCKSEAERGGVADAIEKAAGKAYATRITAKGLSVELAGI